MEGCLTQRRKGAKKKKKKKKGKRKKGKKGSPTQGRDGKARRCGGLLGYRTGLVRLCGYPGETRG